jgi:eukaryotic-like serine/threonine-protein kinase
VQQGLLASATSPTLTVIAGSTSVRALVCTLLRIRWPEGNIIELDPFSQTLMGAGFLGGAKSDAIILGGISTVDEAVQSLKRLRARDDQLVVILLIAAELQEEEATLLAAGAKAVLRKDQLSGNVLIDVLCNANAQVISPREDPQQSTFHFSVEGDRHTVVVPGMRSLGQLASTPVSQVFFAERLVDNLRVVVKIPTAGTPENNTLLRAMCRRYEFLAQQSGRYLVRYLDAGICGLHLYTVMEYLPKGDLRSRLDAGIAPMEAAQIMFRLAGAMAAMHASRFAHMDIKPENIFFRGDGSLVLIDFNITTPFGGVVKNPDTGEVLGTPFYMSPEQGQGLPVDGRSDLYSAGVVFFEMLTGHAPFTGESAAQTLFRHIHDEIPLLPKPVRQFQPIVDMLLAKSPHDRYASAADLAFALSPALSPTLSPLLASTPDSGTQESAS